MAGDRPSDAITLDRSPNGVPAPDARMRGPLVDLPRYEVLGLIGEGGMGEVHRVRDARTSREVALKIVHRAHDGAGSADHARFLREACVQAQLEHPGVVAVYDLGGPEGSRPYFTMRVVEGITLAEVIHRIAEGDAAAAREFTRHRLLTAFLQVCLTVDYAHARGVIHRDLKPANVMLGSFGEVYVLDWGLARPSEPSESPEDDDEPVPSRGLTLAGMTMGTRGYMPPEQARGRPLDPRADVFALGATLFELLALEPLFDEAQAKRLGREILTYNAAPSQTRRGAALAIPLELDLICIKATAQEKDERFASVRELHDALEAIHAADRDLADRTRLAATHRERADKAKHKALSTDSEVARETALGEIGRALALAPDDAASRQILVELLTTPPRKVPAAVVAAQAAANEARLRKMQLTAAAMYTASWVVLFPALLGFAGVTVLVDAVIPSLAWFIASVTLLLLRRYRIYDTPVNLSNLTVTIAIATTSFLAGPHLLVPALATATLMGHMLVAVRRQRPSSVVLACLALVVPAVLAWRGIHSSSTFVSDGLLIHGAVPPTALNAYVGLTVVHLFTMLSAAGFATRFRGVLDANVTKNALFAWQLGKLVPRRTSSEERALERERARESSTPSEAPRSLGDVVTPELPIRGHRYERLVRLGASVDTETWSCRDHWLGREIELTVFSGARGSVEETLFLGRAIGKSKIEHPSIAPLYDLGSDEQGQAFFTTKLVRGESLEQVIARKESSLHSLLGTLTRATLALAHAHARGVAHGALGIRSILLGPFGEVYVVGWGEPIKNASPRRDVRALGTLLSAILEAHPNQAPELEAVRDAVVHGGLGVDSARELAVAIERYLSGDRDAGLRTRLAIAHRERARAATERAFQGDDVARVEALREIGSAVALSPDEKSLDVLLSLLTKPPREPPREVTAKVELLRMDRARRGARVAAFFVGGVIVLYPVIALLTGVRSSTAVVIVFVAWLIAEVLLVANVISAQNRVPWSMLAMMVATSVTSLMAGPFLLIPALANVCVMGFALIVVERYRLLTAALGCLAIIVPTFLQVTGLYCFYEFDNGHVVIHGALSPEPTGAFLSLTFLHLLALLFAADYAARFRDALDAAETESLFASWQLSKIVTRQ